MQLDSVDTSNFLIKYQPLIHKTLYRLRIKKSHMNYEDYYQELQIQLLNIRMKFLAADEYDLEDSEIRQSYFIAYATNGLYWHGLNIVIKDKEQTFSCSNEDDLEWISFKNDSNIDIQHSNIFIEDFFKQAKKRLTAEDYELFTYLSSGKYTTKEIAEMMKVSVPLIYDRKERIKGRLEGIKECLID